MGLPNRQSVRLSEYDYSKNGYYFITICTQDRKCLFGSVGAHHDAPELHHDAPEKIEMKLNEIGTIVNNIWETLTERFPIFHDIYQIMPNHIHAIIVIKNELRAIRESERAIRESPLRNTPQNMSQKRSLLSQIVGYFKMNSTKQIRKLKNCHNLPVWQRNYHEHIIRNDRELNKIREYIKTNPLMWERDRNNPTSPKI